ncbi:MAG: GspH/FimT family pseudopilin [Aquabacterium sp.]
MSLTARLQNARRQLGFSLIEALTCTAVMSVVAGVAVPSLQELRAQRQLDALSAQIETDLQYARSEAVRSQRTIRFAVGHDVNGSCYVIHSGPAGRCRCVPGQAPVCETGATSLRSITIEPDSRIQLRASSSSIGFDAQRGTVTPTATLRLTAADGRAVHQIINLVGRIRSCSPQGRMPGHKAC